MFPPFALPVVSVDLRLLLYFLDWGRVGAGGDGGGVRLLKNLLRPSSSIFYGSKILEWNVCSTGLPSFNSGILC